MVTTETLGTLEDSTTPGELAAAALTLARRFAAGATMWCVSPQWPAHGDHVAVEFVHPVIVGKRALPAVHVTGDDVAGALRMLVRAGDVLVAVSTADEPCTIDLMRRGEAWGLTRLWLGVGDRPAPSSAEHLGWVEGVDPELAARSGDVVLLYHLLWELTHVVFEHPGLLEEPPECAEEVCITCSDEGLVGEVRALRSDGAADVVVAGERTTVDISLVEKVVPGDLLLIHAGVALTTLAVVAVPERVRT